MCRIASLFWFHILKEAFLSTRVISKNLKTRVFINFFFLQEKLLQEIHAILTQTWVEHAPPYATVKNLVAQFKRCDISTCVAPRLGWHKRVAPWKFLIKLSSYLVNGRICAKSIAEQLGISIGRIVSISHEILAMRKFSANMVPKIWMRINNFSGVRRLSMICNYFGAT